MRQSLTSALKSRDGVANIRLKPAHLGTLHVRVEVSDGRVSALFRAESEQARGLLESNRTMLRHALEAQGLTPDRVVVEGAESERSGAQFGSETHAHDEAGQGRPGQERHAERAARGEGHAGQSVEGGDPPGIIGGAEAGSALTRVGVELGIDTRV